MFFIFSKLLAFLIRPISWLAFLLLFALFAKKPHWRKRSLQLCTFLFFLLTNHFLCNLVIKWWEPKPVGVDALAASYDIGIVLGGYSNLFTLEGGGYYNFNERGNRLVNALELYHEGKIKKILLTGGSGSLLHPEIAEAIAVKSYLLRMDIPEDDIILEERSRNTWENALFTKRIVVEKFPDASCLLITSAWHMPRSKGCFAKAGLECTPFPVDFLSERNRWSPDFLLFPDKLCLYRWELIIKEWFGFIAYKIRGYA